MSGIILGVFGFAVCIAILAGLGVVLMVFAYWALCLKNWVQDESANRTSTKPGSNSSW